MSGAGGGPRRVRVAAYAKLTLSLEVVGVRDDGYHELDALTVSLSEPHDVVEVEPADAMSMRVAGPFAAGVPADATNLAWRAALALDAQASISLHKGIPHGGGLGGGSADAAAVLAALGGTSGAIAGVAAGLGADVPFCVAGGGAARMRGLGEILDPVTVPPLAAVVATPPFGCSTPAVYRAWDELAGPRGAEHDTGVPGIGRVRNDLEPAAWSVEPRLERFAAAVTAAAGRPALLAGSGSSYAVVFAVDDRSAAAEAATRVAAAVEAHVVVGVSVGAGVHVMQ